MKHPKRNNQNQMEKSLDQRLKAIRNGKPDFILADAKDADMAFGIAATGKPNGDRHPSLQDFRQRIRDIVEQEIVDIMLMSASTNEVLGHNERLFDNSIITPAVRANDTTDIWLAGQDGYRDQWSQPFRTATIDHIQCGKHTCTKTERAAGTNLGLYSLTFNNDPDRDRATLQAFKEFRIEAEQKKFRYILEVFAPNMAGQVPDPEVGRFLNDHIARTLAGVTSAGRPLFLKIPYNGPRAMEELVNYDNELIIGILGGASGPTLESFRMIAEAKKHGARAALFGRRINLAQDPLRFIQTLRRVADEELTPEEADKYYNDALK